MSHSSEEHHNLDNESGSNMRLTSSLENPFRFKLSTISNSHKDHSMFTPDYDDVFEVVLASVVRLMDRGRVPGPEGVRRVSRPKRPSLLYQGMDERGWTLKRRNRRCWLVNVSNKHIAKLRICNI